MTRFKQLIACTSSSNKHAASISQKLPRSQGKREREARLDYWLALKNTTIEAEAQIEIEGQQDILNIGLVRTVEKNDINRMEELLSYQRVADPNTTILGGDQNLPLSIAVRNYYPAMVAMLIRKGADIDTGNLIAFAAASNQFRIVRILLAAGADIPHEINMDLNPQEMQEVHEGLAGRKALAATIQGEIVDSTGLIPVLNRLVMDYLFIACLTFKVT